MDNRLVIPKDMRENVLRAKHFGHAGRDSMLRESADIWWPRIHREIVEKAQNCPDCQLAGKNLKCIKSQKEFSKIPEAVKPNEESSLDFAGPFQNGISKKKYLLVSVDNHSGWPDAMFLPNPSTDKVLQFVNEYISKNGIPKRIRTDPGTAFKSEKFKQFGKEKFINHVICPVRDHRGNGKVERMIRTINERLRTNKNILVSKDKSGISNILFALRSEKRYDGKSAFEKQNGRKPNTLKSRMIEKCILEKDPKINLEPEDFSDEADSTILIRERVRGTKLEGSFKRVKGKIVGQSGHTITVLPEGQKGDTVYSKRDVAITKNWPSTSKMSKASERTIEKKVQKAKVIRGKRDREEKDIGKPSTSSYQPDENNKFVNKYVNSEATEEEEMETPNNFAEQPTEAEIETPQTTQKEEIQSEEDEIHQLPKAPIKGAVKWEKRISERKTKKPDRWGNNFMVTKVEKESTDEEESLPSVFEIQLKQT